MNKNAGRKTEAEPSDVNLIALAIFASSVQADAALDETWRKTVAEMLEGGVPDNIGPLLELVKEPSNDQA